LSEGSGSDFGFTLGSAFARTRPLRRLSSVVERILGKAEVDSSILSGGTIGPDAEKSPLGAPRRQEACMTQHKNGGDDVGPRDLREQKLAQALRENLRRRKVAAQTPPPVKTPGSESD
jgi:hypothetical protein